MKRLVKEDLIDTIRGLRDLHTFLIVTIIVFILLFCIERGERVKLENTYKDNITSIESELAAAEFDRDTYKVALDDFKEENLALYKNYTEMCQFWRQSSLLSPVDLHLVFLEHGDMCYYDAYHNNALYYMDENGILIPLYNEDGSIKTFDIKEK